MSVQQNQKVDGNKPAYHVQPNSGWLNDPNGPIYYKGQYHIFFQHVGDSADWQWRICWGHCVSKDLVHWHRLPDALLPSPDSQDASGCWSGCCSTYNEQPYLIYTGVILNNPKASKRIKCPQDEFVCLASLDQSQSTIEQMELVKWMKNGVLIDEPPEDLEQVYGWRDPFIFQNGDSKGQNWKMILGAGEYEKSGIILMYEADDLLGPWQYCGKILEEPISEVGSVCECPLLVKLPPYYTNHENNNNSGNNKPNSLFLLAAGAYEYQKFHPEALSQPVFGWIGELTDEQKFNIIDGPFKLDYGDAFYAATCQKGEAENEIILWAWMMETPERKNFKLQFDYSGCLGVPRIVQYDYDENQLVQLPHPKLLDLREQLLFSNDKLQNDRELGQNSKFLLNDGELFYQKMGQKQRWVTMEGNHLEVRLKLNFLNSTISNFCEFFRIFGVNEEYQILGGVNQQQFVFKLIRIGLNQEFEQVKQMRLPLSQKEFRGGVLELIVFVDGSLIEMFTGCGKSLCTRLYCGSAEQRKIYVYSEVLESCKVWKLKNNVIKF